MYEDQGYGRFNFAADKLYTALESGETLIWTGKPSSKRIFLLNIPLLIIGLIWLSTSLYHLYKVGGLDPDNITKSFDSGLIVAAIAVLPGLALFLFVFWIFRRVKKLTYGITNKRMLLIDGDELHSMTPEMMRRMGKGRRYEPKPESDNPDVLYETYKPEGAGAEKPDFGRIRGFIYIVGFLAIPNIKEATKLIKKFKEEILLADRPDLM